MPKLVIKQPNGRATVHELKGRAPCVTVLGRSDDVDVVLPDASVSRIHAQVWTENGEWWVADTQSENGIIVRGKATEKTVLVAGDPIVIGNFRVFFVGDETDEQFIEGRFIGYLPPHLNASSSGGELTFRLTGDEKRRILEANKRMDDASIHRVGQPGQWTPGGGDLTFGREARIPIKGWFTGGICAQLSWDPHYAAHVLHRKRGWVHVSVNRHKVADHGQSLRPGDTFRIGRSRFRYTL